MHVQILRVPVVACVDNSSCHFQFLLENGYVGAEGFEPKPSQYVESLQKSSGISYQGKTLSISFPMVFSEDLLCRNPLKSDILER